MRLKRVRIFGFKTFADRTDVNLDGGIVAVVGPNGCGKSNLVDAILWALGENNARHLRAGASHDVIFSGSARRRPVGFAEVSLLFDNDDGSLPVDTAEVAVTRRLGRGGDSEFLINGRICRQRDVYELLADSGLGRAGYAIVGQKEIDQALAASPEDRRAWVDEAAGVQRYRVRKAESTKRLESAREHLTRVHDILRELETQRVPLQEEAEIARKYRAAVDALRDVETGILVLELTKAAAEVHEIESRLASSAQLVREEHLRAEDLERQADALGKKVLETEHRIEEVRVELQNAISATEAAASNIKLGEERLKSLEEVEQTLESSGADQFVVQAEAELAQATREEVTEQESVDLARNEIAGVGDEAKLLGAQLKEIEVTLAQAREAHAARLKRLAEVEHRRERREQVEREIRGIASDLPKLLEAKSVANAEVESAMGSFIASESQLKVCEEEISKLRLQEDLLGAKVRGLMAQRAALEGRERGLEATIQSFEGLSQGSRAVLEAASKGTLSGAYLPVGQSIRSSPAHALAIEIALGGAVNDLIVDDEHTAQVAIEYLKTHRLGRATFRPISLASSVEPKADPNLLQRPAVIGLAVDLVKSDDSVRPVIEQLLGRVLVVSDLATALALGRTSGWSMVVTLDGEVVHSSGAISGGHLAAQHSGLVQRMADLAQIQIDLSALDLEIGEAEADLAKAVGRRQELLTASAGAKENLNQWSQSVSEAKEFLRTISSELQAAERARERLAKEQETLADDFELPAVIELETVQRARDELVNSFAARSADAEQAKSKLRETEYRLSQASARKSAVAKRLEAAVRNETQRKTKLESLEPERVRIRHEIARLSAELAAAEAARIRREDDLQGAQSTKDGFLRDGVRLAGESKAARENIAAIADSNHQAELARARADAKRAAASERLIEEYGISSEEAVEMRSSIQLPPDAQPLANRLRKEIKSMGPVNIGAIEAFERLTMRHDDLSSQRADILEGIDQVEASIRELDNLTRDRFLDTFGKVEAAYAEMFSKLFGGGEGRVLLNSSSVLESGIDIEVTLPGKKRQRLELLSGGERALCAAAFLFALLQVKPSPLVVLDEVDAPLDGRNVERFGDLLEEFSTEIQFIVITHNPATIGRAPVWLGVTMQEPGVSTLVPVRLPAAPVAVIDASYVAGATAMPA